LIDLSGTICGSSSSNVGAPEFSNLPGRLLEVEGAN